MKKQLFSLVLMLLPLAASARDFNWEIDGINYKLNSSTKTAQVIAKTGYEDYTGNIIIPSSVDFHGEYSVTGIANNAFSRCSELTSVTIPNTVTSIGSNVFEHCSSLNSIVIEEGNPNYDSRENCNAIIGTASNKLLYGCNGSFIPSSVTSIGNSAFLGSGITSIIIPDEVTSIESEAFSGCKSLSYIYIGKSVESIGYMVFYACENLKTVEINSNAIVSKNYNVNESNVGSLFDGAYNIEEFIIGDDVTSIGDWAFYSCSMTSVKMSDNVTSIGNYAFRVCGELSSVTLSNNLTYIGQWAFYGCKLSSITIPQSVKCIDLIAFQGCNHLTKVEVNSNEVVSRDGDQFYTLTSCFGSQVKEYVLGEDIKKIAYIAFAKSDKLTSVTISSNLTCVDDSAFHKCTNLTDIYCYAEQVPETGKDIFVESNYKNATLHVPAASVEAYKNAEQWKDFGTIVALTDDDPKPTTEIIATTATQQPTIVERYTIDGKRIVTTQRGLNIIKMSDGTTRKVVVK